MRKMEQHYNSLMKMTQKNENQNKNCKNEKQNILQNKKEQKCVVSVKKNFQGMGSILRKMNMKNMNKDQA